MRFAFHRQNGIQLTFGAALLAALAVAPNISAQDQSTVPAAEPAASATAVFENRIPPDQLAFLNDYTGKTTKEIVKDKRFHPLMKAVTPRTEFHYGHDMSLFETIDTMLHSTPLPVDVRDGRYVTIGSRGGTYLMGRGFLWFDLKEGIALGGVYFHPTNGEPTPTLAVFSRQLNTKWLGMSQLPGAFQQDLAQWATLAAVPTVTVTYFVPEDGKKYVLVHDEDYCQVSGSAPGPPQTRCEQMDADSAEADMNAAYFMRETHNAANATAWMLEPDQVSWIGVRQQTCGVTVACRIRMTRARTRVLLQR
jgi:uncharacterized protein YecT (DUF1311 family)